MFREPLFCAPVISGAPILPLPLTSVSPRIAPINECTPPYIRNIKKKGIACVAAAAVAIAASTSLMASGMPSKENGSNPSLLFSELLIVSYVYASTKISI